MSISAKHPAMRALEDLTPGGSEYIDHVQNCVAAIKRFQDMQHRGMLMWAGRAHAAEKLVKQLEAKYRELARHHNVHCTCMDVY